MATPAHLHLMRGKNSSACSIPVTQEVLVQCAESALSTATADTVATLESRYAHSYLLYPYLVTCSCARVGTFPASMLTAIVR